MSRSASGAALIQPSVSDSHTVIGGRADCGLLIVCDHATNALPPEYGTLGLAASELQRHIAYDIGVAAVTRGLAEALGAPAILSHYSRLLIDLNRGLDDPTLVMRLSDGAVIPGNRHLDAEERAGRIARFYEPYHAAIDRIIDQCLEAGVPPALLSIHSYTPIWKGVRRPWHAAVLWDRDYRLAEPLLAGLRAQAGFLVGDNEPYDGRLQGDCMWQHGTRRGLAHALLELRQDLITEDEGQRQWAERLTELMTEILGDPAHRAAMAEVRYFGSHTDETNAGPRV